MDKTVLYVILALVLVAIGFVLKQVFADILERKRFRGESFTEGVFISFLLSILLPKEGTQKKRVLDNRVFFLDSTKSIREFYLIRVLCVVFFFIMGSAILTTTCMNRYSEVYTVDETQPFTLTGASYDTIVEGVTFNSLDVEKDLDTIKQNVYKLSDKADRAKFDQTKPKDLYNSLIVIQDRLGGVFTIFDILIIVAMCLLGWMLPFWILGQLVSYLYGIMFFEFDRLETLIYMNASDKVSNILQLLLADSVAFRELFRAFIDLYDNEEIDAYEQILSQDTLPDYFVTLVRYLQLVEGSGNTVVCYEISANKDLNEDKLKDELDHLIYKRKGKINMICGLALVISMVTMVISAFSSLNLGAISF